MYIAFEGIVGTGNSTQALLLFDYLKKKYPKLQIRLTREPGGTEIAEEIRTTVQGKKYREKMDVVCEAYLYAASRAQSLRKIVKPCLAKKGYVVADRSVVTSIAYQGAARGLGIERVLKINDEAVKGILPDKIIYLDLWVDLALKRIFDFEGDKWESMDRSFFVKAHQGYLQLSKLNLFRDKWVNIDARGTKPQVFERIIRALNI